MNLDRYQHLYNYLETEQLPDDLSRDEQKQIMNQSQFFEIRHNLLYCYKATCLLKDDSITNTQHLRYPKAMERCERGKEYP